MKKFYKLPIQGTVLVKEPLTGNKSDPVCVFPLAELPNLPTYFNEERQREEQEPFSYICWNYNIDEEWCEVELEASEEFHNWLSGILPQLNDINKEKGWKLDKSKLVKK